MRQRRFLAVVPISILSGALLVACTTASPGWTYQPAPSVTAAPSAEASAEPSTSPDSGAVAISALGIAYEQATVTVPAGVPFKIEFSNKDAGTPHNVAIHQEGAGGVEVFKGEIFNGVETRTYDVPALEAGAYVFVCSVHPTMVGTLTSQ